MVEEHDREVMLKSYCNEQYNAEVGSVYGDDVDDVLCDCIIITDDNDRYRLNIRFIERRCPYLIPSMHFNETTQQYTIHTSIPIDIIKEIFYALKYENINVKDWLQLERILKMAFEYVLYTVNASINNGHNLDFFRLKSDNLFEILNDNLLKINDKMDVWILLKRWISIDRKKHIPYYRQLLKSIRYNLLSDEQRDLLIVIGGWEKNGSSNIVEILDINDNKWRRVEMLEDNPCEINGTIIVAGGSDGRSRLRTAEIYDAHKNQWTKIRRSDAAAYAMSGKMYIAGGYTGETVL
ncbi:Kelch-like protein [Dirofilaria immitis]